MRRLATVMLVISCLLLPVFAIGIDLGTFEVQERYSPSAVVWSEDFSDISGWEFWGMSYYGASLPPSYSVSEGMLRFEGEDNHWTIAMYNYTQGVGTWSFDLDVQDQYRNHFYVSFFSGYWDNDSVDWPNWGDSVPYEYGIAPFTGPLASWDDEFILYRRPEGGASTIYELATYSPPEMIGWHHIDITRNASGGFDVYFNGVHQMSAVDTTYTAPECFKIYSQGGPAIDNIVVDDEVIPITPPPDIIIIVVIVGGALVAIVVVVILIRRKP